MPHIFTIVQVSLSDLSLLQSQVWEQRNLSSIRLGKLCDAIISVLEVHQRLPRATLTVSQRMARNPTTSAVALEALAMIVFEESKIASANFVRIVKRSGELSVIQLPVQLPAPHSAHRRQGRFLPFPRRQLQRSAVNLCAVDACG
eukprot:750407-Hanusia_phi.AAC.3